MFRRRGNQLSPPQMCECGVDRAFGKPGGIGNRAYTGPDVTPFSACSLTEEVEVNDKRGRFLIVPDQIAHQHIEHVIVEGDGAFETGISK